MLDIIVLQAQFCVVFNNRVTSDNSNLVVTDIVTNIEYGNLLSTVVSVRTSLVVLLNGLLVRDCFSATPLDSSSGLLLALVSLVSGSGSLPMSNV